MLLGCDSYHRRGNEDIKQITATIKCVSSKSLFQINLYYLQTRPAHYTIQASQTVGLLNTKDETAYGVRFSFAALLR